MLYILLVVATPLLWVMPSLVVYPFLHRRGGISTERMTECASLFGIAGFLFLLYKLQTPGLSIAVCAFSIGVPILWYLIPTAVVSITRPRYLKRREAKLRAWREVKPPQNRYELGEYLELVAHFPEYVVGGNRWRDPETGLEWEQRYTTDRGYRGVKEINNGDMFFWLRLGFAEDVRDHPGIEFSVRVCFWRELDTVLLQAIRQEGECARERVRTEKLARQRRLQEEETARQAAIDRERAQVAAALEEKPQPPGLMPKTGKTTGTDVAPSGQNPRDTSRPLRPLWADGQRPLRLD